jgi:hypothetical protein
MRINRKSLAEFAYSALYNMVDIDGGLSKLKPEIATIDQAELCLSILRAIAEGKKRFVIDIVPPAAKAKGGGID